MEIKEDKLLGGSKAMSFWRIMNVGAWILSGIFAILIVTDFIKVEKERGNLKE